MSDLSQTFAALGDPIRLAIVERLLDHGPQPAGALNEVADVTAPAISRHLKVLREAGIVTRTVDRQRRIYAVSPAAVRAIGDWTLAHAEFWAAGLDRLEALLKSKE